MIKNKIGFSLSPSSKKQTASSQPYFGGGIIMPIRVIYLHITRLRRDIVIIYYIGTSRRRAYNNII